MSHALTTTDRAQGCLLGGAIGDALGEPVTILPTDEIQRLFGTQGIRDYAYDGRGRISGPTQMGMFAAEGMLRARQRMLRGEPCDIRAAVHNALLRWLVTQEERPALEIRTDGWLVSASGMRERRMFCGTCMAALKSTRELGNPAIAADDTGSCGVHFSVPVGLAAPMIGDDDAVFGMAADLAALTHASVTSRLSAGYFAVALTALLDGKALKSALERASRTLRRRPGGRAVSDAVCAGIALAASPRIRPEDIEKLGTGRDDAAEVLAVAVCCALHARDFPEGVLLAINHSGASYLTAAAAGNLLGATLGVGAIPSHWVANLRLGREIARLAHDLHDAARGLLNLDELMEQYPVS